MNRLIEGIVSRENDHEGIIEAIPMRKAEDVIHVIRSGIRDSVHNSNEIHSTSASSSHQPMNTSNH